MEYKEYSRYMINRDTWVTGCMGYVGWREWKKTGNTEIWDTGNGWVKGEAGKTEIQEIRRVYMRYQGKKETRVNGTQRGNS
jgi:hypothetical protein